jgi:choline dehydrogenase
MVAYDVVVVGAGAAGCVVGARLSQTGRSVCVVEAGPDLRSHVPADFRDGWDFPRRHEWGFESLPDDRGESLPLRRGKLVGGTSWMTRFAVRGAAADFNRWAQNGCVGWNLDEVLPWFRRIETDQDFPDQPWHGDTGPIPVTRYLNVADGGFATAAIHACEAIGIAVIDDHNRPGAVGVARMPMTARDGMRVTSADAYLPIGATQATLTVLADTLVADVIVRNGSAAGVRLSDGRRIEAALVVVCAGVYGSPALLMRSGIGPADHLREMGLPITSDLAGVGSNLADHPQVWLDPGYSRAPDDRPPLHTLATFRSSRCGPDESPDLALWIADPSGDPVEAAIEVLLMTPSSRGALRLASADPTTAPLIRLPKLDAPGDYERLVEGLLRAKDMAEHPAIRHICDRPATDLSTPEAVRMWVRQERYSIPHTVGTCAMGDAPDNGSVVDAQARVYGIDRLAVVDASIIPLPPSGFPHIVTIMLAERLSAELADDPDL